MSFYEYCAGNAVTSVDPSGLKAVSLKDQVLQLLDTTDVNVQITLWESDDTGALLVLNGTPKAVGGCPANCRCSDVTVQLSYTRPNADRSTKKKIDWKSMTTLDVSIQSTATFTYKGKVPQYLGVGRWQKKNPAYEVAVKAAKLAFDTTQQAAVATAEGLVSTALSRLPNLSVKDLIAANSSTSVTVSATARICQLADKSLVASVCRFSVGESCQIGQTKENPMRIPVEAAASGNVSLSVDLCKGTISGTTKGVVEFSIDLPGPLQVTTTAIELWNEQIGPHTIEAMKLFKKPKEMPQCKE
jgi:hypothetical protein